MRHQVQVDKKEFAHLFIKALDMARTAAQEQVATAIPEHYRIILHGAGYPGVELDLDDAVSALYLDEDKFIPIIDVAVKEIVGDTTKVFVRASPRPPGTFNQTWNDPPGMGPFKVAVASVHIRPG